MPRGPAPQVSRNSSVRVRTLAMATGDGSGGASGGGTSRPEPQWMDARPRPHRQTGIQKVGGKLLAASPDERLHTFEDGVGAPSEVGGRIVTLADGPRTVRDIVSAL